MGELLQLLRHLITHGPARNPTELDQLLGLAGAAEQKFAALEAGPADPAPAPAPVPLPPAPVFPSPADYQPPGGAL